MPLGNCEINLNLNWSENCFISSATGKAKYAITNTKLYNPIVTLSNMVEQSKFGFKRTINWNKYQLKVLEERRKQCLGFLTDPNVKGVNGLFVLSFKK